MEVLGIIIGIVGVLVGVYLGIRSLFQSSDMEALQKAIRANSQATYNYLDLMGASAQTLKSATDLHQAKELATGINEVSQAAQNSVIAFSKVHAQFAPAKKLHGNASRYPYQSQGHFGGTVFLIGLSAINMLCLRRRLVSPRKSRSVWKTALRALPEGRRRTALAAAAEAMFAEDFAGRILPFEAAAAARYPGIVEIRRADGGDRAGGWRRYRHA